MVPEKFKTIFFEINYILNPAWVGRKAPEMKGANRPKKRVRFSFRALELEEDMNISKRKKRTRFTKATL